MYTTGPTIYELLISAKAGTRVGIAKMPGAVQQCRNKNLFNSAKNENFDQQCRKFEQIKCGHRKLNGNRLYS